MKNIIIIGAGFAGLSAAAKLRRISKEYNIIVIDKKQTFDFLPLLPDCLGRGIKPEFLNRGIKELSRKLGFEFICAEVSALDLEKREVSTFSRRIEYEYLAIASGSETNFYGNNNIKENSFKVDGVEDIKRLSLVVAEGKYDNYVIGGGGYTGVEIATNLRLSLKKRKKEGRIIIVERSPSILGPLPQWMRDYVNKNLKNLGIEVLAGSVIDKIEGSRVSITGGVSWSPAAVIWVAGVRTADFMQNLNVSKNPQGRINADKYMRVNSNCFCCGDAAYFPYKGNYLRMAVQFSIMQGACCGENIVRSIRGKKLKEYLPLDLGYIIPMANNASCGNILGINVRGLLPTVFHFTMCIYRSSGLRNRLGIIGNLIKGG